MTKEESVIAVQLKTNRRRGFTLVEVIVVLVILAILAAIAIPAMTGWIDKAKEKRLIVGCRTSVTAAQTLIAETYGATGEATAPENGAMKALSGLKGDVTGIQLMDDSTQIQHLTYTEGSDSVTYCADATCGDYYNFNMGIINVAGLNAVALRAAVLKANLKTTADSNTPIKGMDYDLTGSTGMMLTALAKALHLTEIENPSTINGADPDAADDAAAAAAKAAEALRGANIQTWAVRNDGKTILLSDQDISNAQIGEEVRTLCYNANNFTYSVGYTPVATKKIKHKETHDEVTYNMLGDAGSVNFKQSENKTYTDYDEALKALNSLPLSKTP